MAPHLGESMLRLPLGAAPTLCEKDNCDTLYVFCLQSEQAQYSTCTLLVISTGED